MSGLSISLASVLSTLAPEAPAPSAEAPAPAPAPAPAAAPASAPASAPAPAPAPAAYANVPFDIGLWPGLSVNARHRGKKVRNTVSLGFGWTRAARVDGLAAGLAATVIDEEGHGVAVSLGANIARGSHHGLQATHGYNHASDLRGVQAGSINHAKIVHGVQFGLLNIGGNVRGAQVGLINYAERADASFALLPITKEGGVRFEVASSDTALVEIGLRLPARYTYAFFGAGLHPFGTERGHVGTELERGKAWELGLGFGGHIPVDDKIFIDLDASAWLVTSGLRAGANVGALSKLRAMVGWQAAPHLALFGGPTLNALVDDMDDPVDRPGYGWVAWSSESGPHPVDLPPDPTHEIDRVRVRVWPGFVVGLRF
jgi:hypothetical protein